jgi:methyl-accepting chemotaxis protein
MGMLNSIKIGPKLIGGFAIVALIAGVIGVYGVMNIKAADEADTKLYEKATVPFEYVVSMTTYFQRLRVNNRDILRSESPEKFQGYVKRIEGIKDSLKLAGDKYEKTLVTEVGKTTYKDYSEKLSVYINQLQEMISLAEKKQIDAAYVILDGDAKKSAALVQEDLYKIVEQKLAVGKEISDENTVRANSTMTVMIAVLIKHDAGNGKGPLGYPP